MGHNALLYRWGFVALDANIEPADRFSKTMASLGWPSFEVSGIRIHHHPEARLERYSLPDATILIIGHAFALDGSSVADCVARVGHADDDSLDGLALALSGRFALIAAGDFGARFYHDAIGSRTIYYSGRGGGGEVWPRARIRSSWPRRSAQGAPPRSRISPGAGATGA